MQELNVVVLNNNVDAIDMLWFMKQLFKDDPITTVTDGVDMYNLLVMLEVFPSRSEAKKNWTRTGREILPGYNEIKDIGKQKKALYIWNPIKESD